MHTIIDTILMAFTLWFILAMFKPQKFAPFFKTKARWKIFGVWIILGMVLTNLSQAVMTPEEKQAATERKIQQEQQQKQKEAENKLKSNKFASALNLDNINQANDIEKFLKTLGITDVDEIKHDEILDDTNGIKGYRIKTDDYNNIILYMNPNKTVQAVRYAGKNLYKDGITYQVMKDVSLTTDQQLMMRSDTEKVVRSILKSPKSADFCSYDQYNYDINNGIATITGYVDAQNSFGAMLRSYFTAEFNMKNNTMTHLIFDGEQVF